MLRRIVQQADRHFALAIATHHGQYFAQHHAMIGEQGQMRAGVLQEKRVFQRLLQAVGPAR
jgi:hypothetical protein